MNHSEPSTAPDFEPVSLSGFTVVDRKTLTRTEFLKQVGAQAASERANGVPRIGLYVHGFNNNFPESLYRLA